MSGVVSFAVKAFEKNPRFLDDDALFEEPTWGLCLVGLWVELELGRAELELSRAEVQYPKRAGYAERVEQAKAQLAVAKALWSDDFEVQQAAAEAALGLVLSWPKCIQDRQNWDAVCATERRLRRDMGALLGDSYDWVLSKEQFSGGDDA